LENRVRFIVNANELPRETEKTEAYFRRYLMVPFNVTIPEVKRDIDLAKKSLIQNYPEYSIGFSFGLNAF
jgi:putative DNA primase/helicase